ncbi:hypothetical protein [Xanthomonas albilineans]|uniref:hypothetical protein n=1 Tax=Xanthomonas albilineans TaxID=29447 RepID=UPI0009BA965E|nr:hypothetical protein [Xanthomonas albilineans]
MKLVKQPELELILTTSIIEDCFISQTQELGWTFTLRVRNPKNNSVADYRLVSQRGKKREWSDPRSMLRFLSEQFQVKTGHFQLR